MYSFLRPMKSHQNPFVLNLRNIFFTFRWFYIHIAFFLMTHSQKLKNTFFFCSRVSRRCFFSVCVRGNTLVGVQNWLDKVRYVTVSYFFIYLNDISAQGKYWRLYRNLPSFEDFTKSYPYVYIIYLPSFRTLRFWENC